MRQTHGNLLEGRSDIWLDTWSGRITLCELLAEDTSLQRKLLKRPQLMAEFCQGYFGYFAVRFDWSKAMLNNFLSDLWEELAVTTPLPSITDSWASILGADTAASEEHQGALAIEAALRHLCRVKGGLH